MAAGSYVWDSAPSGVYDFSIHGPNGFLRRFAGAVVPDGQNDVGVPSVTVSVTGGKLTLTLANAGRTEVRFSLQPNAYAGLGMMRYVKKGAKTKVVWPTPVRLVRRHGDGQHRHRIQLSVRRADRAGPVTRGRVRPSSGCGRARGRG